MEQQRQGQGVEPCRQRGGKQLAVEVQEGPVRRRGQAGGQAGAPVEQTASQEKEEGTQQGAPESLRIAHRMEEAVLGEPRRRGEEIGVEGGLPERSFAPAQPVSGGDPGGLLGVGPGVHGRLREHRPILYPGDVGESQQQRQEEHGPGLNRGSADVPAEIL